MNISFSLPYYTHKLLDQAAKSIFTISSFHRYEIDVCANASCLIDYHPAQKAFFYFIRLKSKIKSATIDFSSFGKSSNLSHNNKLGLLLNFKKNNNKYFIWLPEMVSEIRLDDFQRIFSVNQNCSSYSWTWHPHNTLKIDNLSNTEGVTAIPLVVIEDIGNNFFQEFQILDFNEKCLYRKSNWFYASGPRDIWKYLINGAVYDPRADIKIKKKFKCQQCANAWWNYLGFLFKKTQKSLYNLLQNEVAGTVLADMSAQGAWGHGFWSDNIEIHSRFHLDGIHLLISQYEKTGDRVWLDAAEKGMGFINTFLSEKINDHAVWYLHDTLELNKKPKIRSTLFGKSIGNSFCINTHIQALTVLQRLCNLASISENYKIEYRKGLSALQRVFNHQPGELFYRVFLNWLITYKTLKKSSRLFTRIKNAIMHRVLIKLYWPIVYFFPRITHPCGFIERDLTLSMASERYHVINVKDLLILYQQRPVSWLRSYIKKGITFLYEYINNESLSDALQRSPYFIELIDTFYLYDKYIENISAEELNKVEQIIFKQTGGYSLDYNLLKA